MLVALAVCSWAALLLVIPYIVAHPPMSELRSMAAAIVYVAGGFVCHQLPERSFYLGGAQIPVCARCAALYWAAPFGLVAAFGFGRRPRRMVRPASPMMLRWVVSLSAIPTLATVALEVLGLAYPPNMVRAVAAVPLSLSVAWVVGLLVAGAIRDAAVTVPALSAR